MGGGYFSQKRRSMRGRVVAKNAEIRLGGGGLFFLVLGVDAFHRKESGYP